MALDLTAAERRGELWRGPLLLGGAAAVLVVLGALLGLRDAQPVQSFAVVFLSIMLEALPFIVLGAGVAAALETWGAERLSNALTRMPGAVAVPVAGLLGSIFPICDCASVPVARRLARRGLHPAGAITFMLAAPIVNPVVLFATAVAFRTRPSLVWGRLVLAYVVALAAGWALAPLAGRMFSSQEAGHHPADEHHGDEHHGGSFAATLTHDVLFMARYLVIGAFAAATIQTLVPRSVLDSIASSVPLSILGMMVLAVGLSICAQADAFVAASFTAFPTAALLAFLVFGPMVDLKLLSIYGGTFGATVTRRLVVAVAFPVALGSLWFHLVTR